MCEHADYTAIEIRKVDETKAGELDGNQFSECFRLVAVERAGMRAHRPDATGVRNQSQRVSDGTGRHERIAAVIVRRKPVERAQVVSPQNLTRGQHGRRKSASGWK